jgi:acyl carrier protein
MTETNPPAPPGEWPILADPTQLQRMLDVIAREGSLDPSKVTPAATLETLGLASMEVVTILTGIEEELDVYIPMDAELSSAGNLAELVSSIARAIASSPRRAEAVVGP